MTKVFLALPYFDRKSTFDVTHISDKQGLFDKNSICKNKKARLKPHQKPRKTWVGKDVLTRTNKEENEPRISEKLTKSQAGRTLKLMPKKQNEVESTKMLITEHISLFEKD